MILGSFTRDDILKAFRNVASVLEERAHGYYYHNEKAVLKKLRASGEFRRVFSCEIDRQRYFEVFFFSLSNGIIETGRLSILTEFKDEKGVFVMMHHPGQCYSDDLYIKSSWELRIFSSHYIERFFERTGMNGTGLSLIEKTMAILSEKQPLCASTVDDNVIRRYGEPSLPYKFLQEGAKETECTYLNDGDIAIVERYGLVPVWRTYIAKEMLFDSQREFVDWPEIQEGIQAAKELSSKLKK